MEARLPSLLGSLASKKFMAKKFQKTVNLREKMKQSQSWAKDRQEGIDNIYNEARINKKDWQKIIRPVATKVNEKLVKRIVLILAVLIAIFLIYWLCFGKDEKWYMVTLNDGDIFFGQISDIYANPVVIKKVYYDYGQLQAKEEKSNTTANEAGNLQLVKMGKEIYGPDGSRIAYQTQIKYMDTLKNDSKVLKAILEYEK